jgi:hypothetical protein
MLICRRFDDFKEIHKYREKRRKGGMGKEKREAVTPRTYRKFENSR